MWLEMEPFGNLYAACDQASGVYIDMDTDVSNFAYASTTRLRDAGHGSAAKRWGVPDVYEKPSRRIERCDWKPAMLFGHLLLPCDTAEITCHSFRSRMGWIPRTELLLYAI